MADNGTDIAFRAVLKGDRVMTFQQKAITKRKGQRQPGKRILHTLRGEFYETIAEVLRSARSKAFRAVNFVMVEAYWNIGKMIVEEEQQGKERAGYGQILIKNLSARLSSEFGQGFSEQSLRNFRQFYKCFPIRSTLWSESDKDDYNGKQPPSSSLVLRRELTWSHYKCIMRLEKHEARIWYMNEAAEQNWPVRALERQINSLYYERMHMSRDKKPVINEMQEKTKSIAPTPPDFIKDPYVLEFLGLKRQPWFPGIRP